MLDLDVVALLELGRAVLRVLVVLAGFAELLEEELLDRDTPLFELVLGLVLLFTVELGWREVVPLFTVELVLLLLGAVCVVLGLAVTACLELVLGFDVLDELVAVLDDPVLLVEGFAETALLLYVLLLLELVVALPRLTEVGRGVASAVVTFRLDRTTALSPLPADCEYLL